MSKCKTPSQVDRNLLEKILPNVVNCIDQLDDFQLWLVLLNTAIDKLLELEIDLEYRQNREEIILLLQLYRDYINNRFHPALITKMEYVRKALASSNHLYIS